MATKLLMLVIFFAIMVSVGIYARKHATSVDGYVLGGRSVGPWLTAFAYGTSYFSAVVFVGYAGQFGWKYGLASTWIGLGNAIIGSLLAWVVLGRRTKVMTQHLNSKTMPDFFGERYESKALKITASAIVFIFLVPYTASVYNGLSRLFGMAFNIAMDPPTFIAQLMGISWGALAGAFLAPFMYGLYWKGVTRAAVWASFAAGVGITVLNLFFHFIASPINAGAIAMVAGLIVVPVVSVLTPKLKKDRVDEIFACYDEKVTITKKRSLEQN